MMDLLLFSHRAGGCPCTYMATFRTFALLNAHYQQSTWPGSGHDVPMRYLARMMTLTMSVRRSGQGNTTYRVKVLNSNLAMPILGTTMRPMRMTPSTRHLRDVTFGLKLAVFITS